MRYNDNVYEWEELTDSKELYVSKPRPISIIFIYILFAIIAFFLLFSYFGKKEIVIKAQGIVRPSKGTTTITSEIPGEISQINFKEGSTVEKGTTLFILNSETLLSQKQSLENELSNLQEELRLNKLLVKSITEDKNFFKPNEGKDFQSQYELYHTKKQMLMNEIDSLKKQSSEVINNKKQKIEQLSKEESRLNKKLNRVQSLISAIKNNKPFPLNNDVYDTKYQKYNSLRDQITDKMNALDPNIEENKEQIATLKNELEALKQENIISLEAEEEALKEAIIDVQNNIEEVSNMDYGNNFKNEMSKVQLSINQLKMEFTNQLYTQEKEIKSKIRSIENEIKLLDLQIKKHEIKAPVSGQINIKNNVSVGEHLQPGVEILDIVPLTDKKVVEILVDSNKISGLKIGQKVRYNFYNLPNNKSGYLEGKIIHINPDATFTQNGEKFHLIKASIEEKPLYNYKGDKLYLKNGMSTDVSIITDNKRIIYYLLEKINFTN
ncbi:HlyD family efflux transporter periplasmic adaptor subunit [Aeribacillus sp. FSL M8-0254]|uniref:HlyD family efflux transporter periplasmic adaptor subunit n=1 Tax=Aeribacillus sp. FSL M8-0254 TaxID=2954577 RepID=UPI0030F7D052